MILFGDRRNLNTQLGRRLESVPNFKPPSFMVKSIEYDRVDDCRQGKQLRVMEVIKMLCERPVTRYRIANRLEINLRTVDRYLTQINELGFKIKVHPRIQAKEGSFERYSLQECPFCKKEL